MEERKLYTEGYELKENEYLLKIRDLTGGKHIGENYKPTGYITKYNKDGSVPVNFKNWRQYRYDYNDESNLDIYIHTEEYREGWKIYGYRTGKSQNWAVLLHPDGFTLEIYLEDFFDVIKNTTIINGQLMDMFKWGDKKLVKL